MLLLLLFDDNKVKMARKPGKKQGKTGRVHRGKVRDEKEIREEHREDETGTDCI